MEIKFKSQICTTLEQSKKLLELGLKPETADMAWVCVTKEGLTQWVMTLNTSKNKSNIDTPAWSLHRLLSIGVNGDYMGLWNININTDTVEDLFEQLIRLIEWSTEDGGFNKEYLKQ